MQLSHRFSNLRLLALAGWLAALMPVWADLVPSYVNGDIFLGVRASADPGQTESYLVKLGNDTTGFISSGALSLGNLGADLTAKYGSDWSSRSDLYWAIFGVRNPTGTVTLYASRERTSVSTPANPWAALGLSARQNTRSKVSSVLTSTSGAIVGYNTRSATANSPVATFQSNGLADSSYEYEVTGGLSDFGTTSEWDNIEGSFGAGASGTILDVFQIAPAGVSLFGTFSISSSGVVAFTKPSLTPVDKDGDGYYDFEEIPAGTSDNNPSDFFKVASVVKSSTSTAVSFNSIASRTYKIYYREDLTTGSWQLIDSVATGPYTDTDPVRNARPKGFYKVAVTSP